MLTFAMLAAGLFIGFTVSTAVRENCYGYYLRYYTDPRGLRRAMAQVARAISVLAAGVFYLCIAVGVCVLIALALMSVGAGYELFFS